MFLERLSELIDLKCNGKQIELAKKSGISQSTIACYYSRNSMPSAVQLVKLADALEVSVDYLLGRENDFGIIDLSSNAYFSNEEKEIINTYRSLSPREKELFNGIFKSIKK